MFFGLSLIFNVLKTLSLITIAIAWIFYRPVLGITLIVIAVGLLYFLKYAKPQPAVRKTSRRSA